MQRRKFGNTDLETSIVAFGTWALGSDWWGETDDPDRLVARALELGITFFDTGDVYGKGANEEILARGLAKSGVSRNGYELSGKFGYVIDADRQGHSESERPQDFSPEHVRRALEATLKRLNTDYLDLYQLHNPRMEAIERDDLFAELETLKVEGKIRHYGIALGPAIGWRDEGLKAICERGITALQTVYNMLEQSPGDEFLAAAQEKQSIGIMARVPTASGLLEDRLTADTEFGPNDHRRHRPKIWLEEGLQKAEHYRFLTRDGERTLAQAALKFILAQPYMTNVIPTVTSVAELEEWAGTAEVPDLTQEELERVAEIYEADFALAIGGSPRSS